MKRISEIQIKQVIGGLLASVLFVACGGGGGSADSSIPVYYPYETVYGDLCTNTSQPTPGCTFNRADGSRVVVRQDPHYDRYGYNENDLWFVKFDAAGNAQVFNDLGQFQYSTGVSSFAGHISGTTIGVGTTGLFWENVAGGTYWLGKNGVLYSANLSHSNYGQAINDQTASEATETSFAALNSDANKVLVKMASAKLVKEYGFSKDKATAVASALNSWAVAGAERGYTTTKDMDKTFKSVFGVDYNSALAAVKDLTMGDKAGMQDLTDRSSSALGLKPAQAQKFMKGMYKKALAQWGYDADTATW